MLVRSFNKQMTLTNDPVEHELCASIIANPDDDAPRLIIADWYDENGFNSRAKFIRNQISNDVHPTQALRCDYLDEFRAWSGLEIVSNFQPYNVWYKRGFIWSLMMNTTQITTILGDLVKKYPIQLVRIGKGFSPLPTDPYSWKSHIYKNITYVICDGSDQSVFHSDLICQQ